MSGFFYVMAWLSQIVAVVAGFLIPEEHTEAAMPSRIYMLVYGCFCLLVAIYHRQRTTPPPRRTNERE